MGRRVLLRARRPLLVRPVDVLVDGLRAVLGRWCAAGRLYDRAHELQGRTEILAGRTVDVQQQLGPVGAARLILLPLLPVLLVRLVLLVALLVDRDDELPQGTLRRIGPVALQADGLAGLQVRVLRPDVLTETPADLAAAELLQGQRVAVGWKDGRDLSFVFFFFDCAIGERCV